MSWNTDYAVYIYCSIFIYSKLEFYKNYEAMKIITDRL